MAGPEAAVASGATIDERDRGTANERTVGETVDQVLAERRPGISDAETNELQLTETGGNDQRNPATATAPGHNYASSRLPSQESSTNERRRVNGKRIRLIRRVRRVGIASLTTLGVANSGPLITGTAFASPEAVARNKKAKPSTWSQLGAYPFVKGGLHKGSRDVEQNFIRLVTSKKGHTSWRLQGLNTQEIRALDKDALNDNAYTCRLRYGQKLASMVFGYGRMGMQRNVTFLDTRFKGRKGAPSICLDGKVRDKEGYVIKIIQTITPKRCANMGVKDMIVKYPSKPPKDKPKKPENPGRKPDVCEGDTVNTGINTGNGGQAQGGACSGVVNCSPINSPGAIVCSEIITPPPGTNPPPTEVTDNPPEGEVVTTQHITTGNLSYTAACADNLRDPDPADTPIVGDIVFLDVNGVPVGHEVGGIVRQSGGAYCQPWEAKDPLTGADIPPQNVYAHAVINSGKLTIKLFALNPINVVPR